MGKRRKKRMNNVRKGHRMGYLESLRALSLEGSSLTLNDPLAEMPLKESCFVQEALGDPRGSSLTARFYEGVS